MNRSLRTLLLLAIVACPAWCEDAKQLFDQAEKLRRQGKRDEAVALYQKVIAADPENVLAHKYYQEMMIAMGAQQQIMDYYKALLASAPDKAVYHLLMGKLLSDADALAEFRRCVQLDPKYFWGHWALAGMLLRTGKGDEAEKEAHVALDIADNAFSRTLLGAIEGNKAAADQAHAAEHLSKAIQELQHAISLDEHYDPAWLTLGLVYAKLGRFGDSLKALEMGQKEDPAEPSFAENLAKVHTANANGLYDHAVDLVKKCEEQMKAGKTQDTNKMLEQAQYEAQGAVTSYEKVIEYAPNTQGAREKLARAYFLLANLDIMQLGDLSSTGKFEQAILQGDTAIAEMKHASEIDPSNANAKRGVAVAHLARASAYAGLGQKLLKAGSKTDAATAFQKALDDAQTCANTPDLDAAAQKQANDLIGKVQEDMAKAKQ